MDVPPISISNKTEKERFDYRAFAAKHAGPTVLTYADGQTVYAQEDPADSLGYIIDGFVKVTVVFEHGKERAIAILGTGDFFGEGCLYGRRHRISTITAIGRSEIVHIGKDVIKHALAGDPAFARLFFQFILQRNEKLKADLVDQLFNSSEKRLARILLTLANRRDAKSNFIAISITQETLANMVGTTRARINQFMRKFSKLGYIEYDGVIRVHNSLLNIISEETHNGE